MRQPYPDPPFSTSIVVEKTKLMNTVWSKWLHGLKALVDQLSNQLSPGTGINASITIAPVAPDVVPGTMIIKNGIVVKVVLPH